ncbi:MAG: L-threonylcarbamoyladenylate synthase [Desulfovibrio sp.]|jgi:L-threonylcarbamoyladenylate synthase|nr:L-threonylcarbamoyladenylate synthase [Desulfovibrio sp.]
MKRRAPVLVPSLNRAVAEAARCLNGGGLLVFPTETFYALGCRCLDAAAVEAVYRVKGRDRGQPLPLLAADRKQAAAFARLEAAPERLYRQFWPGPLTVLLPALPVLPELLVNAAGLVAVRVSPHSEASLLARLAGCPLTASSANLHGRPPASRLQSLDCLLARALEASGARHGVFEGALPPSGGLPSTLVEPLAATGQGGKALRLLREGAISVQALEAAGFRVV